MKMTAHVDYTIHARSAFQTLVRLSQQVHQGALDANLVELVSLRISQVNGCVFCLDMHVELLRKAGMDQRKLDTLPAWRESPLFDARERVALGWGEALNQVGSQPVPEAVYEAVRTHFDDRELSDLAFAVAAIRAWNMLNVGLHKPLPDA